MKTKKLEQLKVARLARGVTGISLCDDGTAFVVNVQTQRGELIMAQHGADYDRWFRAKAQSALDGLKDGSNRVLNARELEARRAALRAQVLALREAGTTWVAPR